MNMQNTILKFTFLFVTFILFSSQALLSQGFDTVWTRTYRDDISNIRAIVTAEDNSFLVVYNAEGTLRSNVVKCKSNGDSLWNRGITFDGFERYDFDIFDIAVGQDGNYMANIRIHKFCKLIQPTNGQPIWQHEDSIYKLKLVLIYIYSSNLAKCEQTLVLGQHTNIVSLQKIEKAYGVKHDNRNL